MKLNTRQKEQLGLACGHTNLSATPDMSGESHLLFHLEVFKIMINFLAQRGCSFALDCCVLGFLNVGVRPFTSQLHNPNGSSLNLKCGCELHTEKHKVQKMTSSLKALLVDFCQTKDDKQLQKGSGQIETCPDAQTHPSSSLAYIAGTAGGVVYACMAQLQPGVNVCQPACQNNGTEVKAAPCG